MKDKFSNLAICAVATGIIYLIWLAIAVRGVLGLIYFLLELGMFLLLFLFIVNHRSRRYVLSGGSYSLRGIVDVLIPTKGEPAEMVEETVQAIKAITYPNVRLYIIDDGNREEIKSLAKKYQGEYLVRPDRESKAYKAASLNYGLNHSYGNYVLVLDADQKVRASIFDDLLGHFKDEKLAYIATRQWFDVPEKDFNHDHLFYEYMQPGKGARSASISCGSGVIYRRSALAAIGGFSEWNIVEDLHTSYMFNSYGFKGIYTNQSYTVGEAPTDLKVIYKQRGTWALDSLRLMLWQMPFFNRKLTFTQKLHYFEMGYMYLVSALLLPLIFFVNYYALFFNVTFVSAGFLYLIFKLPSFYFTLRLYDKLGRGSSASRMWAALSPIYLRSLLIAILRKKPKYQVTEKSKTVSKKRQVRLILPQTFIIVLGVIAILYHLTHFQITTLLVVNFFWFIVIIYWLWPVFPKALARKTA